MSPDSTTVLLTGIGLDGGPDVIRALRADPKLAARVVGVDSAPEQPGRYLCDSFHQVSPRDDPGYVGEIARIAEAEGAQVIYPLPTSDQEIFAAARDELEGRGFAVPVSPPEAVRVCDDKWLLYEQLRELRGDLIPETRRVSSAAELEKAVQDFGYPDRRVCVRRPFSRGGIGLRVLDSGPGRVQALLEAKPGSPLVSLDELLDVLEHADEFPIYLVQEYLPGDERDVDLLCRAGEVRAAATRRSLAMIGGAAAHAVLEPAARLEAAAREIARALGLDAVVNVAFRENEGGAPKLLEINPRVPMSILSGIGGGINFVALAVRQSLGEQIEPLTPTYGGRFLLHYRSVVTDAAGNNLVG